jgi:hypothetical protein
MSASVIKNFKITYGEEEVVLAVDMAVLTPELATEINNFWGNSSNRLDEQDGDVVLTAVRLFGSAAIRHMLAEGGAGFGLHNAKFSSFWTAKVLELQCEGWPSAEGLGIRIVEACVDVPDFFSCEMEEVDAGTEGGAA